MEILTPVQRRKKERDEKIVKLFQKWQPLYGRSGAYHKIAETGIAAWAKIIEVVKAHEATKEPEEALNV